MSVARTLYSRASKIVSNHDGKIKEFHHIADSLKVNGFPSHRCTFPRQKQSVTQPSTSFVSIPYIHGISEPIKRALAEVGVGVAMKPSITLGNIFHKPKDRIDFEKKSGLVYQISCRNCDAVYIGETGRSIKTRKREHFKAVKALDTKKSALCQHVVEFDHSIDWENVKVLKSEPHFNRRRIAESFLINKTAETTNVLNRNDGANFPPVYKVLFN